MTLLTEASATTAVAERPIQHPDVEPLSWRKAAERAHALLSQTMPDEETDEFVDAAARFHRVIRLPPVLFG